MVIIPRFPAFEKYRENGLQAGRAHGMMRKIKSLEARYEKDPCKRASAIHRKKSQHVSCHCERETPPAGFRVHGARRKRAVEPCPWREVFSDARRHVLHRLPHPGGSGARLYADSEPQRQPKLQAQGKPRARGGALFAALNRKIRRDADGAVVRPAAFYRGKSARGHRKRH